MRTEYRVYAVTGQLQDVTEDPKQIVAIQSRVKRGTTKTVRVAEDGTEQLIWESVFPPTPLTYMGQEGFRLVVNNG